MVSQTELVSLLDTWLEPKKIKDYTFNGLQFEGKKDIYHIGCAVDLSLEILQEAVLLKVDFLITHHGMIWGGLDKIVGFDKKRISILCNHNINLYCSHLPLDIHPKLGNNAIIMDILGLQTTGEIFFDVGYYAESSLSYQELINKIKIHISDKIVTMNFGPTEIKKIAICSGGATLDLKALFEASKNGVHTILSGETNSLYYHYAKELSMNIICAGHYATEVFGVQKLMKEVNKIYNNKLHYTFIDFPTNF